MLPSTSFSLLRAEYGYEDYSSFFHPKPQYSFPQEPLVLHALTTFRTSLTTAHLLCTTELDWHAFDIFNDMKTRGLGSRIEELINSCRPPLGSRLNPIIINDEPTPTPDPNDHPNTVPIPRRTI
ncbi:hypothetical protein CPB84DRAFT_1854030 [Gymnopilus junonius]|uniref:Uncharacterized protein n=1 Tax=Gymnopilus junonius TaxID=109634 RepID=A0A9P5N800_GYMJU|nr:hypothetical protein CPB84DRAFT_1854030 [Gymnopilus junonius]